MKACCVDESGENPLKVKSRSCSRRAKLVGLLLFALVVASGAFFIREKRAERRTEVISEMMQFGLALLEFEQEFGGFPSDDTAEALKESTGTELPLTGEHVLNQFKAYGIAGDFDLIDEISRVDGGWSYFPGSNQCSKPLHPLLVSPRICGKRMVLRIDNSVGVLGEGELGNLPGCICPPVSYQENSEN